jgi:peptidoglycan/LPS O-acetylase OafA/YrhL
MLLEKPFNKNNNDVKKKRREILNYLSFIKFWAMILIIRLHILIVKKHRINYGARMCEFLFISSGFLVGYNYYKREMPATYYSSCKYSYKHLKYFYPVYIMKLIYKICIYKKKFTLTDYEIIIFYILMVRDYKRNTALKSSFSKIPWFINVLLYLYFLSPFLLMGIKSIKNSLIIFIFFAIARLGVELLIVNGASNIMDFNFHHGCGIRLMEFYLGMLMIPLFFKIKSFLDKIKNEIYLRYFFTFIQLIFPIAIYYIMLKYNYLRRCHFVLIFCVCIFLISFDYGYLSNTNTKKICKEIMSCQMEMYLIHKELNNILSKIIKRFWIKNTELIFLEKLGCIFIIAYIYRKLFRDKISILMDKIVDLLKKIFIINFKDYPN